MSTGYLRMTRRVETAQRLNDAQKADPFVTGIGPSGEPYGAVDAQSRLAMVRGFDLHQCRLALKAPGLQLMVQQALERRIRKLRAEIEKGGTG